MTAGALRGEAGQASVLLVGALLAVLVGTLVLGGVARGVGRQAEQQRAADLAALAGAQAMHEAYPRLFEPATEGGQPNPRHLTAAAYVALGRRTAEDAARRNAAQRVDVAFPDGGDAFAPVRIAVATARTVEVPGDRQVTVRASAEAELAPPTTLATPARGGDEYAGPLATRQGKPMRPDVAQAFDRMERAAREDGVSLLITSAFRSNAEQAALFAAHPDPKWVARPGTSLHRLGTELDLGPPAAYGWLAANAPRFGFKKRYAWALVTSGKGPAGPVANARSGGTIAAGGPCTSTVTSLASASPSASDAVRRATSRVSPAARRASAGSSSRRRSRSSAAPAGSRSRRPAKPSPIASTCPTSGTSRPPT